jgi:hypothetical protein
MDAETSKALAAFGFLTVLESPEHGMFGGYLVLSPQGRPLEFRCSTPVIASRAQEILYGPTLRPYLLCDVIGQSLLNGSELPVNVVLTDQRDMLPLALVRPEQVLLVVAVDAAEGDGLGTPATLNHSVVCTKGYRIFMAQECQLDAARIESLLKPLKSHVALGEPFERIRAAITEAQLAPHDAAEYRDDRAAA